VIARRRSASVQSSAEDARQTGSEDDERDGERKQAHEVFRRSEDAGAREDEGEAVPRDRERLGRRMRRRCCIARTVHGLHGTRHASVDERASMTPHLLFTVLRERARLRRHERWSREELEAQQMRRLRQLRAVAYAKSPFYARHHHGLHDAPLAELPPVTKTDLMRWFDDAVTDRSLRLDALAAHVATMKVGERLDGRWWVASTSGTTGLRGIFPWDDSEWVHVLASYARANEWAGLRADLFRHLRIAVVSSRVPWHQSALVGAALASRIVPTLRLDATQPMAEIARELDTFRPESLVAYASMARILADEQLSGRLHIAPRAVMSASEVLTADARDKIRAAWDVEPFDVYAATETAGIASECSLHRGLHLYEDLVITEIVDEQRRPVPPGVYGAKVLVTVLFAHTLPLIRYEMSDSVALAETPCPCGRVFRTVLPPRGRREDALDLPATAGGHVRLHPIVVHRVLEPVRTRAWQVVNRDGDIRILLEGAVPGGEDAVARALERALRDAGAAPTRVAVEHVAAIPKSALGKTPLVKNFAATT
jgi:phenylacetate-CoA ligase